MRLIGNRCVVPVIASVGADVVSLQEASTFDENMPVIAVAPNDHLLEKLKSNLEEVRARGGKLFVLADADGAAHMPNASGHLLALPPCGEMIAPIVFTVPLQLLAYYVAVQRGTDVDQPRNLAKSVTVE